MEGKNWGAICHLSSLLGYVTGFIGNIVGPLIIWVLKKDEYGEVDYHGKESLNFNLSLLLYAALLVVPSLLTLGFGFFIFYPILLGFHIIFSIIAGIKAKEGELYRYPMTIRFIS